MYCHLHPLDTVASEVKKTLRKMEENTGDRQLSSAGCVSEKVLAAFDRLRYSDNIGDPRGFKIHLANCGMKKGAVQSTRGNRLHIFFNQAELHANNRDVFSQYVTSHCPKNIDYLEKLRHDYNMAMTQEQLQSVAILVIFFALYYDYCKVHDFLKSITQVILVYNNFIGNTS